MRIFAFTIVLVAMLSGCTPTPQVGDPYWPYDELTNAVTFDDGTVLQPPTYEVPEELDSPFPKDPYYMEMQNECN